MAKIKTIRREGGSRILAVTDIIPVDWIAVIVVKTKQSNNTVIVTLEKVK